MPTYRAGFKSPRLPRESERNPAGTKPRFRNALNMFFTEKFTAEFASEWIDAWNARDLDRILKHYAREIQFTSPFVERLLQCKENTLHGIAGLRIYFGRALNAYPDLRFTLRRVYSGPRSLVIEYESVSKMLAAEMMEFNDAGLVIRVNAHYSVNDAKTNE
jgi:hypothetical protein